MAALTQADLRRALDEFEASGPPRYTPEFLGRCALEADRLEQEIERRELNLAPSPEQLARRFTI